MPVDSSFIDALKDIDKHVFYKDMDAVESREVMVHTLANPPMLDMLGMEAKRLYHVAREVNSAFDSLIKAAKEKYADAPSEEQGTLMSLVLLNELMSHNGDEDPPDTHASLLDFILLSMDITQNLYQSMYNVVSGTFVLQTVEMACENITDKAKALEWQQRIAIGSLTSPLQSNGAMSSAVQTLPEGTAMTGMLMAKFFHKDILLTAQKLASGTEVEQRTAAMVVAALNIHLHAMQSFNRVYRQNKPLPPIPVSMIQNGVNSIVESLKKYEEQ